MGYFLGATRMPRQEVDAASPAWELRVPRESLLPQVLVEAVQCVILYRRFSIQNRLKHTSWHQSV